MAPDRTTFRPERQQPDKLSFKSKMLTFIHEKMKTWKLLFMKKWFEGKLYKTFVPW